MVRRNDSEVVAIAMSLKLSREMLPYADRMAQLYRDGRSYEEIGSLFFPESDYPAMIHSAIRRLFGGHPGGMGIEAFEGIIPKEELRSLERAHKAANGNRMYSEGKGIYSLTREQTSKNGEIGGRKSGMKSVREKTGIHALTSEERAENSRRLHESRGVVLWRDEELATADRYSQMPQYRRNFSALANRVNLDYHQGKEVRDAGTIRSALARYRKSQNSK